MYRLLLCASLPTVNCGCEEIKRVVGRLTGYTVG